MPDNPQKLKETRNQFSPRVSDMGGEGMQPSQHPDFRLLISRIVKEYISVVLNCPNCVNFFTAGLEN